MDNHIISEDVKKTFEPKKASPEKSHSLFCLRNKIFVSFFLPILFVIIIGIVSYNAASGGLAENSNIAAREIRNKVDMISKYTEQTVKDAEYAQEIVHIQEKAVR